MRATLVAILQQLNRAESMHEGLAVEQMLELGELERLLARFWAIEQGPVKVPKALGLLVQNHLVEARRGPVSAPGSRAVGPVGYAITAKGKQFLIEALARSDRIS